MISLQDHYDERAAQYAQPDPQIRMLSGRSWSRTFPIRCPICHQVFFAWELAGRTHTQAWIQHTGFAPREVCSHPLCREAEQKRVLELQPSYQAAMRGPADPIEKAKPSGLTRLK